MRSSSLLPLMVLPLLLAAAAGCKSSSGGGCKLSGGTTLAPETCPAEPVDGEVCVPSAWPKFRRDAANTGRTTAPVVSGLVAARRLFPQQGQVGPISTTPILGDGFILVGSGDTNVYVVNAADGAEIVLPESIDTFGAISASPLLGRNGTIFVASGDGSLIQYEPDGNPKHSTGLGGFLSASPNIGDDGTIYITSNAGTVSGVCPNGRFKFQSGITSSESTVAVTEDPENQKDRIIVFAQSNGEVRSVDFRGRQRWSFFASPAGVSAAVTLDLASNTVYVADLEGRVFALDLFDGSPRPGFPFRAPTRISASMALGRDGTESPTLYIADLAGGVHAIDRVSGAARWVPPFDTGGVIRSSPAVSTNEEDDILIVAADVEGESCGDDREGNPLARCGIVYALADIDGAPVERWRAIVPAQVGNSSPSIGTNGIVYIGAEDGVLYRIIQVEG